MADRDPRNITIRLEVVEGTVKEIRETVNKHGDRLYAIELKSVEYAFTSKIIFGLVGMILFAFTGAIIALVFK